VSDEDYCEDEYELESPVSPTPVPGDVVDFTTQQQQYQQQQQQQQPPPPPDSSVPLLARVASSSPSPLPPIKSKQRTRGHGAGGEAGGRGHRHTASIASLIRGEERTEEDGWSPVADGFAIGPPPAKGRV